MVKSIAEIQNQLMRGEITVRQTIQELLKKTSDPDKILSFLRESNIAVVYNPETDALYFDEATHRYIPSDRKEREKLLGPGVTCWFIYMSDC